MPDYALTYFGKSLADLQYIDVENFFAEEHLESDQIEFKSFNPNGPLDAKLPGIIEGIAAFLNSSGGILVWGAPEGVKVEGRKEKAFIGNLTKLPLAIEKDWLISKISDKIIPLPVGVRVTLLAAGDGQVAVFEIDESPYSPHQTSNSYPMRIDGQNKPAPHHYIEALFKKVSFPRLQAHLKVAGARAEGNGYAMNAEFWFFNFSPYLNEEKLFYRIIIVGGIFMNAFPPNNQAPSSIYGMGGAELVSSRRTPAVDIPLYHSMPERNAHKLFFPTATLSKVGYQAKIIITFGGKAAPIKICEYSLNFNDIRNGIPAATIEVENVIMSEKQREMDRNEFTSLQGAGVLT